MRYGCCYLKDSEDPDRGSPGMELMIHRNTKQRPDSRVRLVTIAAALAILGLWSCSDSTGNSLDVIRAPSEVAVIALDSSAPALEADSVSFYAVEGQSSSAELYFDSAGTRIDRLLRFEVGRGSLDRLPGGQRIHHGDSVLITIRVTDPGSLQFTFSPSGLVFKHNDPAILTIGYGRALTAVTAPAPIFRDHGHGGGHGPGNGGHGNETDLAIWLQESASSPFIRLDSEVDTQAKEIEAEIPGFSRYAVAY